MLVTTSFHYFNQMQKDELNTKTLIFFRVASSKNHVEFIENNHFSRLQHFDRAILHVLQCF